MKTTLLIHHHLGLGDHLDCNGMVRWIRKHGWATLHYDQIGVFSKDNYYDMIEYMYRDDPGITVFKISRDDEYGDVQKIADSLENAEIIRVGHEHYPGKHAELSQQKNCWEFFYEQLNMPYEVRSKFFHVERDYTEERRVYDKLNPKDKDFIFIHEDPARGFTLNRDHFLNKNLMTVENDITENIFHFINLIQAANEIHCMESSFKTLVDLYALPSQKLFYHDFRNQPLGQHSLDTWEVVSY